MLNLPVFDEWSRTTSSTYISHSWQIEPCAKKYHVNVQLKASAMYDYRSE